VHLLRDSIDYAQLKRRIDTRLSTACAQGNFNQLVLQKYFVVARRSAGSREIVVLNFARGGGQNQGAINLYDPGKLATAENYLFQHDRTGRCQVFILGKR
jgi:hypothetical protein